MAKTKGGRIFVTLECLNCRITLHKNLIGVCRYSTTKNRRNTPSRLELKKYCKYCNIHTFHKETK